LLTLLLNNVASQFYADVPYNIFQVLITPAVLIPCNHEAFSVPGAAA